MNYQDAVEFPSRLQREVNDFFRGRIAIDERLAQTLQFTGDVRGEFAASCWHVHNKRAYFSYEIMNRC